MATLRLYSLLLVLTSTRTSAHREKGRQYNLRSHERHLHTHLSPYETLEERQSNRKKSKLARDDAAERDVYMPISERAGDGAAGDGTTIQYSTTADGVSVDVSVSVDVDVTVNTNNNIPPSPVVTTPNPTAECIQWDISYVTEIEKQYFQYQYYSKSGKGGKSGKSSKSGKSGKGSKSGDIVMKEVEVKREVKSCIETRSPGTGVPTVVMGPTLSPLGPSGNQPSPDPANPGVGSKSPSSPAGTPTTSPAIGGGGTPTTPSPAGATPTTPSPAGEGIPTPKPFSEIQSETPTLLPGPRPTPIPTMMNITPDPTSLTPGPTTCEERLWHPNPFMKFCSNDDNFPDDWMNPENYDSYFYPSLSDCCMAVFGSDSCEYFDVCLTPAPTMAPTTCEERLWHPNPFMKFCSNDENYPEDWTSEDNVGSYFYDSLSQCCMAVFGSTDCESFDVCVVVTPTTSPTTCDDRMWHPDPSLKYCTNDDNFPEEWTSGENYDSYFYDSLNDCCFAVFGGASCASLDVCTSATAAPVTAAPIPRMTVAPVVPVATMPPTTTGPTATPTTPRPSVTEYPTFPLIVTPMPVSPPPTMSPVHTPGLPSLSPIALPPNTFAPTMALTWGFDNGVFPIPPWTTQGDPDGVWAVDQTQVAEGTYSIKSPDFESGYTGQQTLVSNATLILGDSFNGGLLRFMAYASMQFSNGPPRDIFELYVDGASVVQLITTEGFQEVSGPELSPGPHRIDFSYKYNPFGVPLNTPSPPERLGAIWIDSVSVEAVSVEPLTPKPTSSPQSAGIVTLQPSLSPQTTGIVTLQPSMSPQSVSLPTLPPQSAGLPTLPPGPSPPPQSAGLPTLPPGPSSPPQISSLPSLSFSPSMATQNISLPTLSPSPSLATQNVSLPTLSPRPSQSLTPTLSLGPSLASQNISLPTLSPSPSMVSQNSSIPSLSLSPSVATQNISIPTLSPSPSLASQNISLPTLSPSPSLATQNSSIPSLSPSLATQNISLPTLSPSPSVASQNVSLTTISPSPSVATQNNSLPTLSPSPSLATQNISLPTLSPSPTLVVQNGTSSLVPTISPAPSIFNGTSSSVPTVANGTSSGDGPAGSLYFEGFESGQFPVAPWITDGDAPWVIDTEHARSGTYSIKSGTLDLTDLTPKYSNLTYITSAEWPDGSLIVSVLGGSSMPFHDFPYFVDGEMRGKLPPSTQWQQLRIPLPPGSHTILFSYISNPAGLQVLGLPPVPDDYMEAVNFDNVYFIPAGVTAAPTEESTALAPSVASTTPPPGGMTSSTPTLPPGTSLPPAVPTSPPQNDGLTTLPPGSSPSPMVSSLPPGMTSQPSLQSGTLPTPQPGTLPPGTSLPSDNGAISTLPPGPTSSPATSSLPPQNVPTLPPAMNEASLVPSSANLNTLSYDFESGVFPEPPWTTGGAGSWAIDQTQVDGGVYSIKSPDFETGYSGVETLVSNATLTLEDNFSGGVLTFKVYPSVQAPRDFFAVYIDGRSAAQFGAPQDFTEVNLPLPPGTKLINFMYQYNVAGLPLDGIPPAQGRLGATWIDTVTIGSLPEAPPGENAMESGPTALPGNSPSNSPTYYPSYLPSMNPISAA